MPIRLTDQCGGISESEAIFLLITCRYLEVADRRITTTIKLVFAQAFVSGSTFLVYQLVRNCVLHRRPFPERGPSTPCLPLGSRLLLKCGHAV